MFSGRRVLVTGGTGMVGRALVRKLVDAGADVCVISLDTGTQRIDGERKGYSFGRGDLRGLGSTREAIRGIQDVFHLAGVKGSVGATTTQRAVPLVINLQVTTNVLDVAKAEGVERLVYTSTVGAYPLPRPYSGISEDSAWAGEPMDRYGGWAKRMGELQIEAYRKDEPGSRFEHWRTVRLTNVYGPGDTFHPVTGMVVGALMARVAGGENPLRVAGRGATIRDFLFSEDAADGLMAVMEAQEAPPIVNLGGPRAVTIADLVEAVCRTYPGKEPERYFLGGRDSGAPIRVLDSARARALGWEPRTLLEDGLRQTWEWFLANRDEHEDKKDWLR